MPNAAQTVFGEALSLSINVCIYILYIKLSLSRHHNSLLVYCMFWSFQRQNVERPDNRILS